MPGKVPDGALYAEQNGTTFVTIFFLDIEILVYSSDFSFAIVIFFNNLNVNSYDLVGEGGGVLWPLD